MDFVNFGEIETKYKIVLACLARDQTGVVIQNQKHQYFPIYFLDLKKYFFFNAGMVICEFDLKFNNWHSGCSTV